ncbi:TPA: phage capsid protein [Streptococcus suis]|uniref:phage major capsid protein n=1 Tax=Streptococcus suis TaxID=1307 RepID=UPI0021179C12|nr:phage capsid protein [Streptococcus suis]MCQ8272209.1 phage capsid protein [Streptococcus suis]MDY7595276.1 phage capsid protein [Streptococcus suis]MDY7595783.1 phage capsid protein [Streptococcus suis]MDY7599931.1 phage capsid protein [Streptococcus suis]UUM50461.1 phage capsid protein [Streptococcus suis]
MAETNLTKMNDLGEIKTIDFVEKFSTNIKELLQLLGVTRMLPLSSDMKIQTYKWDVVEKTDAVGEGEDIPLSKVTRKKAKEFTVEWFKRRRAVSAEAIARHGASRAIDEADLKLMRNIQNGIKKQFVTFLGANPTRIQSTSLQKALAASWGKAATFEEFDGAPLVSLVNPLDVADYLGDTKVLADASNTFGMTLLKNFLGTENVIVLNAIPQGKVYTTAVENLVWAYLNVNSSDLGNLFADYSDETGFIAASRDRQLKNLTFESVFFGANTLFAEIPEGVIEATIQAAAPGVGG